MPLIHAVTFGPARGGRRRQAVPFPVEAVSGAKGFRPGRTGPSPPALSEVPGTVEDIELTFD